MDYPYVINIQKYSIHDGDGIRTTVFFKGCPLSCLWCHNPESQRFQKEVLYNAEKCVGCFACVQDCPQKAIHPGGGFVLTDCKRCSACGVCTESCLYEAREIAGKTYEVNELIRELEKDRMFYEQSGGGITLSGGEVMAQPMEYLEELVTRLHRLGYHIAVDTCGYAPYERFERILPYVDLFLYDIKAMDHEKHKELTGVGNALILENLKKLSNAGANIYLRLPLVEGKNAADDDVLAIIDFLKAGGIRVGQINLLPYHNTGKSKYARLNRAYEDDGMKTPPPERMEQLRQLFLNHNFTNVRIGG